MRLQVDAELCQGHTQCWAQAPELIELSDEDGHARALDRALDGELLVAAGRAVEACPEQAIRLVD